ncbi:membrane protein [Massilia sp. WF1]|uniref:hypothetical protein n=1 Tax=unclassified Massilia TaxID=2609279 RepID=UPI000649404D|nr:MULTISPECIES: hypothetical protein [unclassified Massilia]ALK96164.1 hypothetical protein AM586_07605 [Massilia sp. WG5]KLU34773.1 membrane protein [Massilia sp. WF1]
MGARGAVIMAFFGAVFAALTMRLQWQLGATMLALPFIVFLTIGAAAIHAMGLQGNGIVLSERTKKALMWSSIGEGIGIFLASNIVTNMHRPDLLLPAIALVVGLHFLPIAHAASFRAFYLLGAFLLLSAAIGFLVAAPAGGGIAGIAAALGLWFASTAAISRERQAKRASVVCG